MQEWASFGEYVNEVVTSYDAGRISEEDAEKRLVPAVVYQVGCSMQTCFAYTTETICARCNACVSAAGMPHASRMV